MSSLSQKQWRFTVMVGELIRLTSLMPGYCLTFGDAYRAPSVKYGSPNSLHRQRLAVDFNLFVDGEWIDGAGTPEEEQGEADMWEMVGFIWEILGGSWGGRFSSRDYNHFSLEHEGRK